jgi:hypothetical protein
MVVVIMSENMKRLRQQNSRWLLDHSAVEAESVLLYNIGQDDTVCPHPSRDVASKYDT